jgi:signal transduction histidine kinase/HAMP domain-containing protein
MLLVLLAVLPGLALAIYGAVEQGRREVREIEQTTVSYLRLAAMSQAQMVQNTKTLLSTLSQTARVRGDDPADCNRVLASVLAASPGYRGFSVSDAQGNVLCSSATFTQPVNVGQREFFTRALDKREFVVGGFQRATLTGKPNLTFGYPILDERGGVERVISAGIDIEGLNETIKDLKLPDGYVVDILDRDGTFIVRWPDPQDYVGTTPSDQPITQRILNEGRDNREHVAEMTGIEGTRRLYAFSSVPGVPDNDLFVNVGVSTDQVVANVNQTLLRNLVTLGLGALFAAGLAWVLGDVLIVRRARGVINTAARLREGDLSARTGLPHDATELGELASSFDEMASALQQRESERNAAIAALKAEEEEQRTLAEVGAAAVRSLDYTESLKDIASAVCGRFSDICVIGVPAATEIVEQSVCVHKSPERLAALQSVIDHYFPALDFNSNSPFVQRLRQGEAVLYPALPPPPAEQPPAEQRQDGHASLEALGSAIVLPMNERGRLLGVLTLIREKDSPPFTPADVDVAQQIAMRVGQALDSARLYQELQQLNADLEQRVQKRTAQLQHSNARLLTFQKELRTLSQRQNEAIEEERRRIAREVHDQIGQALTSIKMDLAAAQRRLPSDQSAALDKIKSATHLVDETIQITRRISSELRPGVLDAFGLEAAVEWQLREFESRASVACALDSSVDESVLSQDVSITAFRILQEALTNVARHAAATQVRVTLATAQGSLVMRVADNGKGIVDESVINSSLGVLGMRERALALNGDVALSGAPGQGAVLTLTIPLRREREQGGVGAGAVEGA